MFMTKITKKQREEIEAKYYDYLIKRTADYVLSKNPEYRFEIKRKNISERVKLTRMTHVGIKKALRRSPYHFTVCMNNYATPHVEKGFLKMILDVHDIMDKEGRLLVEDITDDDFLIVEMMKF